MYRMGKHPMSQTVKNKMSLIPILHSIASCLKLPYISKLVNLNYSLKISLKVITMGTSSIFHNGIHLKILFTLIYLFHRDITYCQRKAFYEDKYDKINDSQILNSTLLLISSKSEILLLNQVQETLFSGPGILS